MSDPWADDLFDRKQSADDLIGYVESRLKFGSLSNENKSQVIAVDAEYGIGKTFFLQRLKAQLEGKYPVAYVDAWSDDFLGKPIVALAATLEEAFKPLMASPTVSAGWKVVAAKTGQVAWIATKGVGLQLTKLAISGGAVAGIEEVIGSERFDGDALQEAIQEGLGGDNEGAPSKPHDFSAYLKSEIEEYRTAKSAVQSLRTSLGDLARSVEASGLKPPVFIIIDELDRCRPDYSLTLLEEIKHVFGVREVCFILGLNSSQLHKSVTHQYGFQFDGKSYVDRFIDRTFFLEFPQLNILCENLSSRINLEHCRGLFIDSFIGSSRSPLSKSSWISHLLSHYKIGPRNVFKFFERLQNAIYILNGRPILFNYLCELIAADMYEEGLQRGRSWQYYLAGGFTNKPIDLPGANFFNEANSAFRGSRDMRDAILRDDSALSELLANFSGDSHLPGAEAYHSTVRRVARFLPIVSE